MELTLPQPDPRHVLLRHFDTRRYELRSNSQETFRPVSSSSRDQVDDHRVAHQRPPRQFCLMMAKSRCSILFHLLVPGGKWQTVMRQTESHRRAAAVPPSTAAAATPLLPPPSAVIEQLLGIGVDRAAPIRCHQRRIARRRTPAVSWSIPTLTQPAFCADVVDPVGHGLALVADQEVVHPHLLRRRRFGCHSRPGVLEVADQFLLLWRRPMMTGPPGRERRPNRRQ